MLAKVYRWKNAGLALGIFVLCSIAMTVAMAIDAAEAPADTGNVEAAANEATFPDPPAPSSVERPGDERVTSRRGGRRACAAESCTARVRHRGN